MGLRPLFGKYKNMQEKDNKLRIQENNFDMRKTFFTKVKCKLQDD